MKIAPYLILRYVSEEYFLYQNPKSLELKC